MTTRPETGVALEAARRIVEAFLAWRDHGREFAKWEAFIQVLINGPPDTTAVQVARALLSQRDEVIEECATYVHDYAQGFGLDEHRRPVERAAASLRSLKSPNG